MQSASPLSYNAHTNASSSVLSGYRATDSRNSNVGRHSVSTNRSWETSAGSDVIGISSSYSLSVANHLSNDYRNCNNTNNLNRDDTSPLGGPSTSDDIDVSKNTSKEENSCSNEKRSIKDRIQILNSNSSNIQKTNNWNKSSSSSSQTTTSGSFCLGRDYSPQTETKGIFIYGWDRT